MGAALFAAVEAKHHHSHNVEYVALAGTPPTVGLGHAYVPSTREDYDNAKELWKGDWAKYRTAHPNDQTAPSPNPTTGRVPNNAPNPGNAEVPDSVKEEDGAPDMTDVREPHSQTKPQDLLTTTELNPALPEVYCKKGII